MHQAASFAFTLLEKCFHMWPGAAVNVVTENSSHASSNASRVNSHQIFPLVIRCYCRVWTGLVKAVSQSIMSHIYSRPQPVFKRFDLWDRQDSDQLIKTNSPVCLDERGWEGNRTVSFQKQSNWAQNISNQWPVVFVHAPVCVGRQETLWTDVEWNRKKIISSIVKKTEVCVPRPPHAAQCWLHF